LFHLAAVTARPFSETSLVELIADARLGTPGGLGMGSERILRRTMFDDAVGAGEGVPLSIGTMLALLEGV
jgi:hypothetical protein